MVVLIVKNRVKPGTEEQCKKYMRLMEENTRKEPGCLMYIGHQSLEDPTHFALYEQYKDREALEAHWASPYFIEYVKNGTEKLLVSRERELYDTIS